MSVKKVKAFFEKVEGDKALQAKLKTLGKKPNETMEAAMSELIEIARTEGFEFTSQDFAEARNEHPTIQLADSVSVTKDSVPPPACTEATAWRGHPPPEGCTVLAGCGYQHTNWNYPRPPLRCDDDHAW